MSRSLESLTTEKPEGFLSTTELLGEVMESNDEAHRRRIVDIPDFTLSYDRGRQ